jgi:hypothetical protein
MRAAVPLIESSNKFRTVATAIRGECLRARGKLTGQNTGGGKKGYDYAPSHLGPSYRFFGSCASASAGEASVPGATIRRFAKGI